MTAPCFQGDRTALLIRIIILFPTPDLDGEQTINSPSFRGEFIGQTNETFMLLIWSIVIRRVTAENTQSRILHANVPIYFSAPACLQFFAVIEGTVLSCS